MQDWTILIISLSAISGVILLASCLVTARFAHRRDRKGKSKASASGGGAHASPVDSAAWFNGFVPRAQPGPNGTAQYMNGWFALDSATNAGWSRDGSRPPSYATTPAEEDDALQGGDMREPHFSRAQRAARRARGLLRRVKPGQQDEGSGEQKSKKKPRTSRTTEAALLEEDAGGQVQAGSSVSKEAERA
ncbi:hypothetical protein JCM10908_005993 [Rhodotorula pacifica]|uniref:uncharacterized protein n=1 Tax=Rhodotorula pacifica TaxID=1495444 RepID=UPI00317C16E3